MENIEEAEKLCVRLNGYAFGKEKKLKAHIHPKSTLKRADKEKSMHKVFSNIQTYLRIQLRTGIQDPNFILPSNNSNKPSEEEKKKEQETIPASKAMSITASAAITKNEDASGKHKKVASKKKVKESVKMSSAERERQKTRELLNRRLTDSPEMEPIKKQVPASSNLQAILTQINVIKTAGPSIQESSGITKPVSITQEKINPVISNVMIINEYRKS